MARKAINYATTTSFYDRAHTMIGVHNFVHTNFYKAVFQELGLSFIDNSYIASYLQQRQQTKRTKRENDAKPENKLKKMKRANVKYNATTAVNGFYSSGCGLDVDKTIEEKTLEEEKTK